MHVTIWYGPRRYGTGELAQRYTLTISRTLDQVRLKFVLYPRVAGKTDSLSYASQVSEVDLLFVEQEASALARGILKMCETEPPAEIKTESNWWPGATSG